MASNLKLEMSNLVESSQGEGTILSAERFSSEFNLLQYYSE